MATSVLDLIDARSALPEPPERRRLRLALHISQDAVAAYCLVSRQAVGFWEDGSREPRGAHLLRYAEVLDRLRAAAQ